MFTAKPGMTPKPAASLEEALEIVADRLARRRVDARRPVCYLPGNAGRIAGVEQWIFDHPRRLRGVDVFQLLALGPAAGWQRAVMGGVGVVTPFIGPGVRELVNAGLARNIRCNLSQVPRLFEGRWRPDVAFAHTSPPDAQGRVTLGLNAGLDIAPVRLADFKVAVVNRQVPRWHIATLEDPPSGQRFETGCAMALADFDLVVEIDEPPLEHLLAPQADHELAEADAIAGHIIAFLRTQANAGAAGQLPHVLQLGIGKIPNAVASALAQRGLSVHGIWSELFSDGVLGLYRAGLIRQVQGPHLRDRVVVGFVIGSRALYEAMRENPDFAVLPQEAVNDPSLIRHNAHMVSINSALAISLSGEVAAATIRKRYYSDVGGQLDFALGASWAREGTAVIALPSVARLRDGTLESRVVAAHAEGAHHTIGADLPVVVVTEQGCADLRALHDPERVEAMLEVAHPQWRGTLEKEARTLPSMQGVGVVPPQLVELLDGRIAVLRAATRDDIGPIAEYIAQLSGDDRRTRYMGTFSVDALTAPDRLARLYDESLDYRDHAAFVVDLHGQVIGVAHAFRLAEDGSYELSFSRRSDLFGQGIGAQLMEALIDWGVWAGARTFRAATYRTHNPHMRALFDGYGFVAAASPDDPAVVLYSAGLDALARRRSRACVD